MSETRRNEASSVTTEAADWYARLHAGSVSEIDAARFRAWIARDPVHRAEFDKLDRLFDELSAIENSPEVVRERAAIAADAARQDTSSSVGHRMTAWPAALAATVALVVGGAVWLLSGVASDTYVTEVGEQRVIPLPDGSIVTLNTATRLRVAFSNEARAVELLAGQANFEVAKDAVRPFVVTAGEGEVRAVGTVFDVYRLADQVTVTLIEGKVAIRSNGSLHDGATSSEASALPEASSETNAAAGNSEIILTAGEQLSYSGKAGAVRRAAVDPQRVTAWRIRKLHFDNTPLADAIAEANRYSHQQIVLDAPQLRSARISGTFEAGKNELLVEGLESFFGLHAEHLADERIVLTPAQ